jgi:N-acetylmuramoyl-L-alanine amidase
MRKALAEAEVGDDGFGDDPTVKKLEAMGADPALLNTSGKEAEERLVIANASGAQVLISIHCNTTAINPYAQGTEVYYFHSLSSTLAKTLSANVSGAMEGENRGTKSSYYYVTLSHSMRSALVETGFISNSNDLQKLISPVYQERIARAIAVSIEENIR